MDDGPTSADPGGASAGAALPGGVPPGATPAGIAPGQLRWHCRRGMKELDVLLTRYLDTHYDAAPAARQASFRQLLELQDPLIYAYCMGREPVPSADLAALIAALIGKTPDDR